MPPGSSSKSSKPKPSEVAAQTKKYVIPHIRKHHASTWPLYSYLFPKPLSYTPDMFPARPMSLSNPNFCTSTSRARASVPVHLFHRMMVSLTLVY